MFGSWLDEFFASYFRLRPVNATFTGMHAYDDRLPDFSESGTATILADADALLRRLAALPPEPLSPSEELDRRLAEGFLLIQRWESQSAHFGWGNPSLFTGEAIFGVISLLLRPYAPLAERLSSASARLAAIPEFFNRVHQLRAAPQAWVDRARRECRGARLLLEDLSIAWPGLESAARAAADAFARFDAQLEHELLPRVAPKLLRCCSNVRTFLNWMPIRWSVARWSS
jgi:hypothetical protein